MVEAVRAERIEDGPARRWWKELLLGLVTLGVVTAPGDGLCDEETDLRPLVTGAIEFYNEHASDPLPHLTSDQLEDLQAGHVVSTRRKVGPRGSSDVERHNRAAGFILVDQPQVNVWIAVMDDDLWSESRYHGVRLWEDGQGRATMYQHVDLPWPLADRHWVIDLTKGWEVTEASQGLIWEHVWDLVPDGQQIAREVVGAGRVPGLNLEDIENAVYPPLNNGGWIVAALTGQQSLLVYRVTIDLGGSIPESWVATIAMAHLQSLLERVAEVSALVPGHYQNDHRPILSGTGKPIARFEPARK